MDEQRLDGRVLEEAAGALENVLVLSQVDSTQDLARRLIDQLDEESTGVPPTAILARRQVAGAGRGERRWASPEGGLYVTVLLHDLDAPTLARMPILAAVAAVRALRSLGLDEVRLKWPNDLLVSGAKIGGVLVHARHGEVARCAVGLGVNVHGVPDLGDGDAAVPPTSVDQHLGPGNLDDRLTTLAGGFARFLAEAVTDAESAVAAWRELLIHRMGSAIRVRLSGGEAHDGELVEITPAGHLRVRTADGVREISSGDVVE